MKEAALVLLALFAFESVAVFQDIFEAVRSGNLAQAKALIEKDPGLVNRKDDRNRMPLHIASEKGRVTN